MYNYNSAIYEDNEYTYIRPNELIDRSLNSLPGLNQRNPNNKNCFASIIYRYSENTNMLSKSYAAILQS